MTALQHDRPSLRFLDNLSRELNRRSDQNDARAYKAERDRALPRRLSRPLNENAYQRHLEAFERLPGLGRSFLTRIFDAHVIIGEKRIDMIKELGSAKRSAALNEALNDATILCAEYNRYLSEERIGGRSPTRLWLTKLRVVCGQTWEGFEELDEMLRSTRV